MSSIVPTTDPFTSEATRWASAMVPKSSIRPTITKLTTITLPFSSITISASVGVTRGEEMKNMILLLTFSPCLTKRGPLSTFSGITNFTVEASTTTAGISCCAKSIIIGSCWLLPFIWICTSFPGKAELTSVPMILRPSISRPSQSSSIEFSAISRAPINIEGLLSSQSPSAGVKPSPS